MSTVALVLVVVALNFRAAGAALVTVTTAGLALAVVLHVAGWAGQRFGLEVPSEIEPVLVALLLGIVTDYSIFFLAGMRERLAAGDHRLGSGPPQRRRVRPDRLRGGPDGGRRQPRSSRRPGGCLPGLSGFPTSMFSAVATAHAMRTAVIAGARERKRGRAAAGA